MKLVQILNKDIVRERLIEEWNSFAGSRNEVVGHMNKTLKELGHEEEFRYTTWYEQMSPLVKSLVDRDELELARREINLTKRSKRINRLSLEARKQIQDIDFMESFNEMVKETLQHSEQYVPDESLRQHVYVEDLDNTCRVFLSDVHYMEGDGQRLEDIMLNVFNETIKEHNVELIFNGDIIQGCLRESDIIDGNLRIDKQAKQFADIIIACLSTYDNNVKAITFIPGNHDRINITKSYDGNTPSMITLVDSILTYAMPHLNIKTVRELNFNNCKVIHGDQFRGKKAIKEYYAFTNYTIYHAHYHHHYVDGNVIGLPSLSEPNEYEKSLGIKPNVPSYYVLDSRGYGKVIYV